MIYLDYQASTPLDPRVAQAMQPFTSQYFGNPHSIEHGRGLMLASKLEEARAMLAAAIGADDREVIFTSGATESNNLAIQGAALFAGQHGDGKRRKIITLATEHKCVLESVRACARLGFEPVILPVQPDGLVDLATLSAALDDTCLLVSVMAVNNETGVIQPIARIAEMVHAVGAKLHCDAAQALGKMPLDVRALDVDMLSVSAHKAYGPMGIGGLYLRRRPRMRIAPLFYGGGQERGLRSGTMPLPLCWGFAEAAKLAAQDLTADCQRLAGFQAQIVDAVRARPGAVRVNGSLDARVPHNLNLSFLTLDRAAMLEHWRGFSLSSGSACTAADVAPSYVLQAMRVPADQARASLRFSLGRMTTPAEIDAVYQRIEAL